MRERRRIIVQGIVQGVGFRPFVYSLARRHDLVGHVNNDSRGVTIEVEGERDALDGFLNAVRDDPPPLALIEDLAWEPLPPGADADFVIETSHHDAEKHAFISPDVCTCDDCRRELNDPGDRRFGYPFINCTNCGPRFTIIQDVPYDRPFTTMAPFVMCADCRREYDDPGDRRFHAQPNACPRCGPAVSSRQTDGGPAAGPAAIEDTAQRLRGGDVVAIKGLGGYHLACDACNEEAVGALRARKHRWDKPFALLVADVAAARTLCAIDELEAQLLASRRRPIVLLRQREPRCVAASVAPGERYLGVMLPYTPLHFLLLEAFQRASDEGQPAVLVLTSGNLSDEPIAYRDDEAVARLSPLADAFLMHNRKIHMRCDDSVTRVVDGHVMLIRRSRGYVPEPIRMPVAIREPLLATGAHLKNTFCLARDRYAFVSHHIGDLENYETLKSFCEGIEHFKRLFDIEPRVVAYDLHPEYLATKYAQELADSLTAVGVQHHHAHIAAVTGERGIAAPVIGVAFDGTGYGTDGTMWGGEFLVADWRRCERVAHLDTISLIGGEQAIHQVWRLAAARLHKVYGEGFLNLDIDFVRRLDRKQWRIMRQMAAQGINSPRSSAMGRLFDAVAALIGIREVAHYEAQAAIELEMIADETCEEKYPFHFTSGQPRVLKIDEAIRAIVDDLRRSAGPGLIAARFHNTVAAMIAEGCELIRRERSLRQVALAGGVFQNALLLKRTLVALRALDFEVLVPSKLPLNDGGISFGQAVVANAVMIDRTMRNGAG